MPRTENADDTAVPPRRRGRSFEELIPRVLYWWHVPERPGTGVDMLRITALWFVSLFAVAIVIGIVLG